MKKYDDVILEKIKEEIASLFLFCKNPIIERIDIRKDEKGKFIHIFTKDIKKAKKQILKTTQGSRTKFEKI